MKTIQNIPVLKSKILELKLLIDYFVNTLEDMKIGCAIIFGSIARGDSIDISISDIDIVAYSDSFSRKNAQEFINLIIENDGFFYDKSPIYIEDFISPRIEYFYKINDIKFDINIFPSELSGYTKIETGVVHDSMEVVIGAMYEHAVSLYGRVPFEKLLSEKFFPFYSDSLREKRMLLLEERIVFYVAKIMVKLNNYDSDILEILYKTRFYFIKWLFIKNRKYPYDITRYLESQLINLLDLDKHEVDILTFKGNNLRDIYKKFVKLVNQYIGGK